MIRLIKSNISKNDNYNGECQRFHEEYRVSVYFCQKMTVHIIVYHKTRQVVNNHCNVGVVFFSLGTVTITLVHDKYYNWIFNFF